MPGKILTDGEREIALLEHEFSVSTTMRPETFATRLKEIRNRLREEHLRASAPAAATAAPASPAMTEQDDKIVVTLGMLRMILDPFVDELNKNFNAQAKHIKALEERPAMTYRGVWSPDDDYRPGDLVTDRGSLNYCWAEVRGQRPGESDAWQLMQKRDAR